MLAKRCCSLTARSAEARISIYSRFQLRLNQTKRCCSVRRHKSPCTLTLSFATRINRKVCLVSSSTFLLQRYATGWATQCFRMASTPTLRMMRTIHMCKLFISLKMFAMPTVTAIAQTHPKGCPTSY